MGHWAPTTTGNDHAWDVLGELSSVRRAARVARMVQDGLALAPGQVQADELESPRMLALAEAVAAGLGRPSPDLLESHATGCAAHADLLAEYVDDALAVVAPVLAGPCARGWRGDDGPARFEASVRDLERRLRAGRTTSLLPAEDRFRRALGPGLERLGYAAVGPDRWQRTCPDGLEVVRTRTRRRAGRATTLVWLERVFLDENRQLKALLEKPKLRPDEPALIVRPPRALWDKLGDGGWVPLYQPSDPPECHAELAVRVAAEKSVAWVETYGEKVLSRYQGPALAGTVRRVTMHQLRRCSSAPALLGWLLVAARVAPDAVSRLVDERRAQLDRICPDHRRIPLLTALDRVRDHCASS